LFLTKDLEEKQKKYGAQSAKTREEMSRMMKDQVFFHLQYYLKTFSGYLYHTPAPFSGSRCGFP
jgi:hypothetical protein